MKTTIIKNFTCADELEVGARAESSYCVPGVVGLYHNAGAMRFQFDMTPQQAIALADALVNAAASLKVEDIGAADGVVI